MKLFTWGANSYGQLSHGFQSEQCLRPREALISHPIEEVVALAAGGGHSLVLSSDGSLMGAGSNSCGQLGDCKDNTPVLHKMGALQEFKLCQVECGWESSYAVSDRGSVIVWGSNKCGQLGVTKDKVTTTQHPVILESPEIVQIASGLRHTAMISRAGHVYVCGRGNRGQLGILSSDGKVPTKDVDSLTRVEGLENVQQVACGQHHTLALTRDGCLYGWGDNRRWQLGKGEEIFLTPRLITTLGAEASVRAGWTHSALLSEGKVSTWGRNTYNQLGHSFGLEQMSNPCQLTDLQAVKQLDLGSEHSLALLENGEVWSWGWNEHGNCGTGTTDNVCSPHIICIPSPVSLIATGGGHSLALTT